MKIAALTALGVGMATVIGALIGFGVKNIPHRFQDTVMGFAAGVMLCAAVVGLILPSLEYGGSYGVWITAGGILTGAVFLNILDRFVPHMHNIIGVEKDHEKHSEAARALDRAVLLVMAIAIHNFPEGIAAGVSFGTGNIADAISVSGGIALQNIPEGMITIAPLLLVGVDKKRALVISLVTGLVEVVGTLVGYAAVTVAASILPFALAFAGGTMLYVISDEMIPETHSHGYERNATYALLIGFIVMLILDFYLG